MILKETVQIGKHSYLVNTMDANFSAVNAVGYETTVHPFGTEGTPNMYRILDYSHAESRMEANENHRLMVARWKEKVDNEDKNGKL